MAIQPRYAAAILDGSKTIELRKRPLAPDVSRVLIYETSPTQMIVGHFVVRDTVVSSPQDIWDRYGAEAAIDPVDFCTYYADARQAVALRIAEAHRLPTPIPLSRLEPPPAVPQSFAYVSATALRHIEQVQAFHLQPIA
jgi:predicted transcriptional regulator